MNPETHQETLEAGLPQFWSVTELIRRVHGTLSQEFNGVWLLAEISGFNAHPSGHWYLTLKDSRAQISSVMFRNRNRFVKFHPQNGMEVLVYGSAGVFEQRGQLNFYIEDLRPKGQGALQLAFEQLKARLEAEGLFDPARKRPLPLLPCKVGLVTAPGGAALRDMIRVIHERFPGLPIVLYPTLVQGDDAPPGIVAGIERLNRDPDVEVIIVGRGGGSMEDLWAFNDERVARAIFASNIPIISAVGHEVDFTIADFVADARAATPSVAGTMVAPERKRLEGDIRSFQARLANSLGNRMHKLRVLAAVETRKRLENALMLTLQDNIQRTDAAFREMERAVRLNVAGKRTGWAALEGRVRVGAPKRALETRKQTLNHHRERLTALGRKELFTRRFERWEGLHGRLSPRLVRALVARARKETDGLTATLGLRVLPGIEERKLRLEGLRKRLESLNPQAVLARGYALVVKKGKAVSSVKDLEPGDVVGIQVSDGRAEARILGTPKSGQRELEI